MNRTPTGPGAGDAGALTTRGTRAYIRGMIKSPEMLREVDERFDQERLAKMTYHEALERYTALWDHARAMGAVDHNNWLVDLEPDIRIAHALNALSSED